MKLNIRISGSSSMPKYLQLVNEIIRQIKTGRLAIGDRLPSINDICNNHDIARDTVVIAYNELKSRGIIIPRHGKGFYVASTSVKSKLRIFMLFDAMNDYKEVLYKSIVDNLGPDYLVDIYFHYSNIGVFSRLIKENAGKYGYYVVMPHFNEDVSRMVSPLPPDKLLIIDKDIPEYAQDCNAVFQNFGNDIMKALAKALRHIRKYSHFKFISGPPFQFIPDGMLSGFTKFCSDNGILHSVHSDILSSMPEKGDLYLVISDHDLVDLLRLCRNIDWVAGKDIGIISYDETPLKEILAGGIAVISTNFRKMGEIAADMIKGKLTGKIENNSVFIHRKSL